MANKGTSKGAAKATTSSGPQNSSSVPKRKKRFRVGVGVDTPWGGVEAGYDLASGIYYEGREQAPVSSGPYSRISPGMADIQNLRLAYDAGALTYGNGSSAGVDTAAYFKSLDGTQQWYSSAVPIAPSDTTANTAVGQAYISDIMKHFARIRYKQVRVDYLPEFTNTTDNATLYIAPVRGGQSAYVVAAPGAGTPANVPSATVQSMKGARGGPQWSIKGIGIDLTPYIAGGTGKNQNEFTMYNNELDGVASPDNQMSVPCAFVVGGFTNVANYKNATVGRFRVSIIVDLLDYIGAFSLGALQLAARKRKEDQLVKAVISELKEEKSLSSSDDKDSKGFVSVSQEEYSSEVVHDSAKTLQRPRTPLTRPVLVKYVSPVILQNEKDNRP